MPAGPGCPTVLDVRTEVVDPHDESAFRRFHEIMWRAEKEDGRPWNPMWTFDEMAGIFREPTAERRYLGLGAYDGDRMVGAGFLSLSLLSNLETAWAFVAVEPDLRGRGYGAVVLDGLVEAARADGRRQLLAGTGIGFEERETSPVITWARRAARGARGRGRRPRGRLRGGQLLGAAARGAARVVVRAGEHVPARGPDG